MCECCVNEDGTVEIEGRKVRYIDPLTDWGFKRLFGSEMNKEILLGFLQDLFPEKDIRDIRYLGNENTGATVGERMTDNLAFVFLEVERFGKSGDRLESMLDKWMYVLKNLSRLMERPVELQERIFRKLFEAARIAAFTREELDEYTNDMMTENDRRNAVDYARKQGRAEGEKVGKLSVAQKMLAAGLDPKMISEMTGLTEPEIRKL